MKRIILIALFFLSICLPGQAKLTYLNDFRDDLTDVEHLFYYNNDVSVLKIQGVELQGLAA